MCALFDKFYILHNRYDSKFVLISDVRKILEGNTWQCFILLNMSRAIALHHVVHKVSALILLRLWTAKQHFCTARNTSDRLGMENYRNAVRNVQYTCTVIVISSTWIRNDCGICNAARFMYGTRGVKNTGCKPISFHDESMIKNFQLLFWFIYFKMLQSVARAW